MHRSPRLCSFVFIPCSLVLWTGNFNWPSLDGFFYLLKWWQPWSVSYFSQCSFQASWFPVLSFCDRVPPCIPGWSQSYWNRPVSTSQALAYSTYRNKSLYLSRLCDFCLFLFITFICFFLISLNVLSIISFHSFEHILKSSKSFLDLMCECLQRLFRNCI